MGAQFPIPVLSVAPDAVRDLEGRDALSGLWTLFTKCKESLQDGRRLENISWRLWYREMMITNLERELNHNENLEASTQEKLHGHEHPAGVALVDEKVFYPLTTPSDSVSDPPPYSESKVDGSAPPSMPHHQPHLPSEPTYPLSSSPANFLPLACSPSPRLSPSIPGYTRRPSISRSRRSSFFNGTSGTPINVGKIIFDMLPSSSSSLTSGDSIKGGMTAFFSPRPTLSHKSTSSTTIASGCDADGGKLESDLILPHIASRLDPTVQMTSIEPSSSPIIQASLNDVGSAKYPIPDIGSILIPSNVASGLPTPEMEKSEPTHNSVTVHDPSASVSTIPTTSALIPFDSISSNTAEMYFPTCNDQNDNSQHDLNQISVAVYTGPPSPSLSDSYARAHPGEVEVKEVGLLPSLSISTALAVDSSPSQLPVDADELPPSEALAGNGNQTPSSSSARILTPIHTAFEEPPTLVVVNPTPNMTPHPTPPATPLMSGIIGPGGVIRSQWLTLPEGATGARQHQLLQAAQLQLPPQMTTLRLPPPSFGSGNVTVATVGGVAINRDFDRSRSTTARASDSDSRVSSENARTGHSQQSQSDRRASPSSSQKQHEQQVYQQSSSSSSSLEREQQSQHRDSPKRLSISSTTSSHISHTSVSDHSSGSGRAESTSTTNTTLSECDNLDTLTGLNSVEKAAMFEIRPGDIGIGMAGQGPKRPGSISTIHSMSTLTDRRKDVGGAGAGAVGAIPVSDEGAIVEYEEDEDTAPLSPLPPPGGLAMSPRSDKRRKRNSAPTLPTSSPLLGVSPTPSGSSQIHGSSPKSATSASGIAGHHSATGKRKQITAGGGGLTRRPSTGRNTSRSHSAGGSSVGQSRSRSRESGVGGLGGFGMTQVAPAPPVVAVAARKAPIAAGGRGRAKVVLGRTGSKAKGIMRRNSSGTGARSDNGTGEQEQERERAEIEGERVEKEHQERMRMEALEKERERSLQVAENKSRMEEMALAREKEAEERKIFEENLLSRQILPEESASKRPVRFNIGSNSDEGSGIGSKSAGSGSDLSGALTKAQGKERQRDVDQRDIVPKEQTQQQQQYQAQPQNQQPKEQQHIQQQPQRQLSKPELRQLQKMEQLHMQHQNQRILPHPLQHQHQLQSQQQQQLGQEHYPPPSRQQSTKQINREVVEEGERAGGSRKGKEKEVAPAPLERKSTKSTSKVNVALDPELAAKVQQSLAAPLLPQNRRKIVLATSESDFETDSDDDGSWSSEDMTGDDEDVTAQDEKLRLEQQQLQQQLQQQQIQQQRQRQQQQQQAQVLQHQQHPTRPQGVQRTQSSHYPAPNNNRNGKRNQQRNQGQVNAQAIIDAAAEAQRQRQMFVKLPSSSFQNLEAARTRSVGLLTQLMNPNPEIFPPNHPYRRGFSSSEIRSSGGTRPSGGAGEGALPLRPLTAAALSTIKDTLAPQPIPEEGSERSSQREKRSDASHDRKSSGAIGIPSRMNFSPPSRPGGMYRTKSAAAVPVSSQLAVGSIATKALPMLDHTSAAALPITSNGIATGSAGRHRLRAPPADAEMEDDSSSDEEPGGISKSAAHEKLKIFARDRQITANAHRNPELDQVHPPAAPAQPAQPAQTNGDDNEVPPWVVSQPQQHQRTRSNPLQRNGVQFADMPDTSRPIAFGYPYNLPISAEPSTPRTTRRAMLSTELPESLRRNLLWERQISNGNLQAMRRTASGGGSRHNVLGGLQPMTPAPRMVQLHAKGTGPPESAINDDRRRRSPPPQPIAGPSNAPGCAAADKDERKRKSMSRNKSWANDDYHFAGW